MFHQVCLLPKYKTLLCFLWRSMKREEEPAVYEWQVLPFGTTCSPCCATYALQRHVKDNKTGYEDLVHTVGTAFYVDNCLTCITTADQAKILVDRLCMLLATGGFDIKQWASNDPTVIAHLPAEAKAKSTELWLSQPKQDPEEPALGLRWNCLTDRLEYRHQPVVYSKPTLRNVYKVMATQYDPLGYLIPFSTRAKILIQDLWNVGVGWDEQIQPKTLLEIWTQWESELVYLPQLEIPRCYIPASVDTKTPCQQAHIFCEASERAYGAVEYLRTQDDKGNIHLAFVMARSRVCPCKHASPRTMCSSDRSTVFVGTRLAEIQELVEGSTWRYVSTHENPADDLTRGKTLLELTQPNRWGQGPQFLLRHPDTWPELDLKEAQEQDEEELRKTVFCGVTTCTTPTMSISNIDNWDNLIKAIYESLHGAASN
ncbi:uncharacterized protein LOC133656402 [Entelurus aequoreus]|uniref:uncharacterized protein LOC133656402 n=1 Tax=Entelurus aequoreus TaxID=161455 RepID=UPI002B1CFF3D|nr:uncharacterized protein LOC133656402 [Entelurus aequoreus]